MTEYRRVCIACEGLSAYGALFIDNRLLCSDCEGRHRETKQFMALKIPYGEECVPPELPRLYVTHWEIESSSFGETHVSVIWSCNVITPRSIVGPK